MQVPRSAIALILALGLSFTLQAQNDVEEPTWETSSENEAVTLSDELTSDDPLPEDIPDRIAPVAPRETVRPVSSVADTFSRSQTESPTLPPSPSVPDEAPQSDVGAPDEGDWNLPDFTNAVDPFFQMDGLKMRIWEIQIRFALGMSFSYDDNIFDSNQNPSGDYVTRISPLFTLGVGDFKNKEENFLFVSYTPQPEIFAINTQQNTVNEFLDISGQYAFSRLVSAFTFHYDKDSNPNSDQVGRVDNKTYDFALDNSYGITGKTFLEWGVAAQYRDLGRSIDYTTLSTSLAIAYVYSPKTRISLGPYTGITLVEGGGEQPFQGVNLTVSYDTLKKFSFRGSVGMQARQFEGPNPSGQSDYITPTFGIGARYDIAEKTSIDLSFSRTVGNSGIVSGQSLITNRASLSFSQRFLSRLIFELGLRYDILQYQGTGTNERTDHYLVLDPSLGYEFLHEQMEAALFYSRRQRTSELQNRDFSSNAFGLRIQMRF